MLSRAKKAVLGLLVVAVAACSASASTKKKRDLGDEEVPMSEDDFREQDLPAPKIPDFVDEDSGAFDLPSREKDGGITGDSGRPIATDGGVIRDAGASDGSVAPPPNACPSPLPGAGDLAVVEIMISSAAGSGDRGEWIEIQSTRHCALNLKGVRVESPRGATAQDYVEITGDVWLPPNGMFIVADTSDPTKNNNLPGLVFPFAGTASDVLKNDGDTIIVSRSGTSIDTTTYPKFTVYPGRSVSFPLDCAWSERSSWERWSYSFHYWTTGKQGTPNSDNNDVACY
jgi:hypothetical protein